MIDQSRLLQRRREYYKKNKQKWAKYYRDHQPKIKVWRKAYYQKNKARFYARGVLYRERNKESIRDYLKRYAERNREKLRKYQKEWRTKNKEYLRQEKKDYHRKHAKRICKNVLIWQRVNKDRVNKKNREWIRRKRLEAILEFGGACLRCGYRKEPEVLQFDHKVPVKQRKRDLGFRDAMRAPEKFQLLCPNCHTKKTLEDQRKHQISKYGLKAREMRVSVLALFGSRCRSCKLKDLECLQLDHVIPRLKSGIRKTTKTELEARKYPERFQLLCATCHALKTLKDVRVA